MERKIVKYPIRYRDRYLKVKPMPTLIIGARCRDGVIIVADRRIVRGAECTTEKKIFMPYTGVVVAASGLTGIIDKFRREVEARAGAMRAQTLDEVIEVIEDVTEKMKSRYTPRLYETPKGGVIIEALVGGLSYLTQGEAELHHVFQEGYAEIVKEYMPIGYASDEAKVFLKALYRKDANVSEMLDVLTLPIILIEEFEVDTTVGGKPQIYTIMDLSPVKIKIP
ncbi:MAG: hypothetical protein QW146_07900 [Candidatus Bathyarchaeia archaeon]